MIDVDWGNAKETLLIWTFYDGWTAQDFDEAFNKTEDMFAHTTDPNYVNIMFDVQHTIHLPDDFLSLGRDAIKRAVEREHYGMVIIINSSQIWHHLCAMLDVMVTQTIDIRFARDANEAYQIIRQVAVAKSQTTS